MPASLLRRSQDAVVQERRGHIGRIAIERPYDRTGARDFALGIGQTNRVEPAAPEPGRDKDQPVFGDRRAIAYCSRQTKFLASSVLPLPRYAAVCG